MHYCTKECDCLSAHRIPRVVLVRSQFIHVCERMRPSRSQWVGSGKNAYARTLACNVENTPNPQYNAGSVVSSRAPTRIVYIGVRTHKARTLRRCNHFPHACARPLCCMLHTGVHRQRLFEVTLAVTLLRGSLLTHTHTRNARKINPFSDNKFRL